jgi:hypothetical protein
VQVREKVKERARGGRKEDATLFAGSRVVCTFIDPRIRSVQLYCITSTPLDQLQCSPWLNIFDLRLISRVAVFRQQQAREAGGFAEKDDGRVQGGIQSARTATSRSATYFPRSSSPSAVFLPLCATLRPADDPGTLQSRRPEPGERRRPLERGVVGSSSFLCLPFLLSSNPVVYPPAYLPYSPPSIAALLSPSRLPRTPWTCSPLLRTRFVEATSDPIPLSFPIPPPSFAASLYSILTLSATRHDCPPDIPTPSWPCCRRSPRTCRSFRAKVGVACSVAPHRCRAEAGHWSQDDDEERRSPPSARSGSVA